MKASEVFLAQRSLSLLDKTLPHERKNHPITIDDGTMICILCNVLHSVQILKGSITMNGSTMKGSILAVVLASTSVLAYAADNASVDGKWKFHTSVAGNESDMICTFTQKDADFSGTCKSDNGDGKATGKVDGKKITLNFESEYNGSPVTSNYTGTLDSATNKITGTLTVVEFSVDGDFTAAPEK
jgi:hypothetical protein